MGGLLPRVYPIVDTATLARRGMRPEVFTAALAEGGAALLQFRHKDQFTRDTLATLRRIAAWGVPLIVNDRADIAVMVNAGVHLGQDDLDPAEAKRIIGAGVIGLSTHNAGQLRAGDASVADYLAIGPVFPTSSKAKPDPVLGVEALPTLRALTKKPLAAIGGITRATAPSVWASGVDAVAVIGDLIPDELTERAVRERMEEWTSLSKG